MKKIHNDVIEYDTIVTSKDAAFNMYIYISSYFSLHLF